MEFVKMIRSSLSPSGHYLYEDASNIKMNTLGIFLACDVGCSGSASFKDFALNKYEETIGSNTTLLDKEGDFIFLSYIYSEEKEPTQLKISIQQFVQLLNEWQEKVCARKPKEVTIKREGDQFILETSD